MSKTSVQRETDTLNYIQQVCDIATRTRIHNELHGRLDRLAILNDMSLGFRWDFIFKSADRTQIRHATRSVLLLRALHRGLTGAGMNAAKPVLLGQALPNLNAEIRTLANEHGLAEDVYDHVQRNGRLVYVGVTSCYTVTCITAGAIAGLHVVQVDGGGTFYPARMPGLLNGLAALAAGPAIQRLFIVAPFNLYPLPGQPNDPQAMVNNALFAPAGAPPLGVQVHRLDVSNVTNVAVYILFDGLNNTLSVWRQGVQIYQVTFAAALANHGL
jgi:hypothetical protein